MGVIAVVISQRLHPRLACQKAGVPQINIGP